VSTATGRPTVDQVANWIRARTKDSSGNEVGTFDAETRPTDTQVEGHIDDAYALVGVRLPALDDPALAGLLPAVAAVVALEAACQIEKSYWPEQVRSDRSPYTELRQEADDALDALAEQATAAAGGTEYTAGMGSIPVQSWTSLT
jgi:hypothetical protein